MGALCPLLQGCEEQPDYERIRDVDEERSDQRHDEERHMRRPVALVTAVMLAIAVGDAPRPKPTKPADTTAAS